MQHEVVCGNCVSVMQGMEANSIDAVVTDPPYGLEFMGKEWDKLGWQAGGGFSKPGIGERKTEWTSFSSTSRFGAANPTCAKCGGRLRGKKKCSCETPEWKPIGKRRNPENEGLPDDMTSGGYARQLSTMQEWHYSWAVEALRVLKPGGHLLAFGGTRTYHRRACAIEDAGFEIRDCIMWVYGSGFPKSLDVSKSIDKEAGAEREVVAVNTNGSGPHKIKLDNHGTGDTGIGYMDGSGKVFNVTAPATDSAKQWAGWGTALKPAWEPIIVARKPLESTVAKNVQKWGTGAINIDGCRVEGGASEGGSSSGSSAFGQSSGWNQHENRTTFIDRTMPVGRWPANLIHDGSEEVVELFPQTGVSSGGRAGHTAAYQGGFKQDHYGDMKPGFGDSGSAARFFYCAKASRSERGEGNTHPTVKPIALMRYLVRLITPPNSLILDPFCGSGTTLIAAKLEGFSATGIDMNSDYCSIANQRLSDTTPEKLLF